MICRVYKNDNFTVRRDDTDATAETLEALICAINDCIDAPDVADVPNAIDLQPWGNNHFVYYVAFNVNGAPRWYTLTPEDLSSYNAGCTVRLVCDGLAPRFVMPAHYQSYPLEWNGVRGTLYKLCKPISDVDREAVELAGCTILCTRAQYAQEIRHVAIFVPNGIYFTFC